MTVTKKRFSVSSSEFFCQPDIKKTSKGRSSLMAPDIEPMAQQRVLRLFQDHSDPSTCLVSFSVRIVSVSETSKWVR